MYAEQYKKSRTNISSVTTHTMSPAFNALTASRPSAFLVRLTEDWAFCRRPEISFQFMPSRVTRVTEQIHEFVNFNELWVFFCWTKIRPPGWLNQSADAEKTFESTLPLHIEVWCLLQQTLACFFRFFFFVFIFLKRKCCHRYWPDSIWYIFWKGSRSINNATDVCSDNRQVFLRERSISYFRQSSRYYCQDSRTCGVLLVRILRWRVTSGSRVRGGSGPLPPRFFPKSCSFQAILSKFWAQAPWPESWIRHWGWLWALSCQGATDTESFPLWPKKQAAEKGWTK